MQYLLFLLPLFVPSVTSLNSTVYSWCSDSTGFFDVNVKDVLTSKDCAWVALKPTRCQYEEACMNCPDTCSFCECNNNPNSFTVVSSSGSEVQTCDWVKADPETRCADYSGATENCPLYCGECVQATPSAMPSLSLMPSVSPTLEPSVSPSDAPTTSPSVSPSDAPSTSPSVSPSDAPSVVPSARPTSTPSVAPTSLPSAYPSLTPSNAPTPLPSCMIEQFFGTVYYFEIIDSLCLKIDLSPSGTISRADSSSTDCNESAGLTFTDISVFDGSQPYMAVFTAIGTDGWNARFDIRKDPAVTGDAIMEAVTIDFPTKELELNLFAHYCVAPSAAPSLTPSASPSSAPSATPSTVPTLIPSAAPSTPPTGTPSAPPSAAPTPIHSEAPSAAPSSSPSSNPTSVPSVTPTLQPSSTPSISPTDFPSIKPECDIDEFVGKTYYFEILGGLCMQFDFFAGGHISRGDSSSVECGSGVSFQNISDFVALVDNRATFDGSSYGSSGWEGDFLFKKDMSLPQVVLNILEQDSITRVLKAELLVQSCISPSSMPSSSPSVTPTLLPTVTPSVYPTAKPSQVPSLIPTSTPSVLPTLLPK